jgi:hypothetical protein
VARERNSIRISTERLRQTGKTFLGKYPAGAEPGGDSTFPSLCDQVGSPRAPFAQKVIGSHLALNVLFQAGRIGSSRRRALRTRSNLSVYFTPTDDGARMTSADDVMVFNIYY